MHQVHSAVTNVGKFFGALIICCRWVDYTKTLRTAIFLPNEVNLLLAFILSLSGKRISTQWRPRRSLGYKTCGKFTGDEIEDLFFFRGARSGLMAVDQSSRVRVVGSGRKGGTGRESGSQSHAGSPIRALRSNSWPCSTIHTCPLLRVVNSPCAKHISLSMTRQDKLKK